jgi:Bacterial Ig domain
MVMNRQFKNKTKIALAIGSILMGTSSSSFAELDNTTTLNVTSGFFTMGGGTVVNAAGFDGQNLTGNQGVILGTIQTPSGSHSGAPGTVAGEMPTVDAPWVFFGNTGMSGTEGTASNVLSASGANATVDFSGYVIAWNGLDAASAKATIPMNARAWFGTTVDGVAQVTCDTSCADGENYTLIYSATVPDGDPSNFGNTQYLLNLTGTITDTNTDPVISTLAAMQVTAGTPGAATLLDISSNVSDAENNADLSTMAFSANTCGDTPTHNSAGVISYIDTGGVGASCSFGVTVSDVEGKTSNTETINVTVAVGNQDPVAANDGSVGAPLIVQLNTATNITILANDTDDVSIDVTSVVITSNGSNGTAVPNATTGVVTYTPNASFTGTDSFAYTVDDENAPPATSAAANVFLKINNPPTATGTSINVNRGATVTHNVVTSDSDGTVDLTTLATLNSTCTATITDDNAGEISFTETGNTITTCSFDYTVDDNNGGTSNAATVLVSVINAVPVATSDSGVNFEVDQVNSSTVMNVTTNDSDADGTLNLSSINITSNPTHGTLTLNDPSAGNIRYTPTIASPTFTGPDSFSYTINDNDGATSNVATVNFNVVNTGATVFLPRNALLTINPATVGSDVLIQPAIGTGSWFTMLLDPGRFTHTSLSGFNHLRLGSTQTAAVNPIVSGIDDSWNFVGQQGLHKTTSDMNVLTDPGDGTATLDFSGWAVAWAAIQTIPMNGGPDNGVASMTCSSNCGYGDTYILDYNAIVPIGDPSNFGGVNYRVHLEGSILANAPTTGGGNAGAPYDVAVMAAADSNGAVITVSAGDTAASAGNTTGTGLSSTDIGIIDPLVNPADGEQCSGGCINFTVTGITPGSYVDVAFLLSKPIEPSSIFRKLINGVWKNFDKTTGDQLGSGAAIGGACQAPAGLFSSNIVAGNQCIFIRVTDGGPNDADGLANGTVVDPGGLIVGGSPNTPAGTNDGCSMSGNSVSLMQRADWLLLLGFIAWLGMVIRKKA